MVIIIESGIGNPSLNPGQNCFNNALGKGMNPSVLYPAMGK